MSGITKYPDRLRIKREAVERAADRVSLVEKDLRELRHNHARLLHNYEQEIIRYRPETAPKRPAALWPISDKPRPSIEIENEVRAFLRSQND